MNPLLLFIKQIIISITRHLSKTSKTPGYLFWRAFAITPEIVTFIQPQLRIMEDDDYSSLSLEDKLNHKVSPWN
jgi:hypothetical protein